MLYHILNDGQMSSFVRYLDEDHLEEAIENEEKLWSCLSTIVRKAYGVMFHFIINVVDETLRNTQTAQLTVLNRMQQYLSVDLSGHLRVLISNRISAPYDFQTGIKCTILEVDNKSTHSDVEEFIKSHVKPKFQRFHLPYEAE